jgi:hypothetical protein
MSFIEGTRKIIKNATGITAKENKKEAKAIFEACKELQAKESELVKTIESRMLKANELFESHRKGLEVRFPEYYERLKEHAELLIKKTNFASSINDGFNSVNKTTKAKSKSANVLLETAKGAASGVASAGSLVAGTAIFGTASTGTAIATLAGAAQTNAILASIGFGAKAAGGLGMVGGGAILGGVALIPAISYLMYSNHKNSEQMKTDAVAFHESLKVNLASLEKNLAKVEVVEKRIQELVDCESILEQLLKKSLDNLPKSKALLALDEKNLEKERGKSEVKRNETITAFFEMRKYRITYQNLSGQFQSRKSLNQNESFIIKILSRIASRFPFILKLLTSKKGNQVLRYFRNAKKYIVLKPLVSSQFLTYSQMKEKWISLYPSSVVIRKDLSQYRKKKNPISIFLSKSNS